ncbi:MAG: hypothetical protein ACRD20_02340 [Terriglobales bacterium]
MKRSIRRRGHRRNPAIGGFNSNELLKLALGAAGGSVGTRYIAQQVLGDKNTGAMGYTATGAIAVALAWAAKRFAGSDDLAKGVLAGGLGALLMRVWQEQISGTSPAALSGYLGDVDFSGTALGAYAGQNYAVPFNYGPATALPAGVMPAAATAPAAAARAAAARAR